MDATVDGVIEYQVPLFIEEQHRRVTGWIVLNALFCFFGVIVLGVVFAGVISVAFPGWYWAVASCFWVMGIMLVIWRLLLRRGVVAVVMVTAEWLDVKRNDGIGIRADMRDVAGARLQHPRKMSGVMGKLYEALQERSWVSLCRHGYQRMGNEQAVWVTLKSGKEMLIGTTKPDALVAAVMIGCSGEK